MIKFDRAAGNQATGTPDNALLTFPNGPRTLAFIIRFDGLLTGDNPQYIVSTGNYQASGSLNVYYNTSASTGVPATPVNAFASRIVVVSDTMDASAPPLMSQPLMAGVHVVFIDYDGTTARLSHCPILTIQPMDGSAVVKASSSTDARLCRELNGSGFMIGTRLDGAANRKCDLSIGRVFAIDRVLSDFEKARLAWGEEITDLGYIPKFYSPMTTATAAGVADRSPNSLPVTIYNSPATSAEPAFGYDGNAPTTPIDSITQAEPFTLRAFQDDGDSALVEFSGTYGGTAPSTVEVQVTTAAGAVVRAWSALLNPTYGSAAWKGTIDVPIGGPYAFEARSRANGATLASTSRSLARFLVGGLWANIGSSSSEYLFSDKSGTGYTVAGNTCVLSGSTPTWAAMTSVGAATQMAAQLAAKAGKPIAWLNYGVAGTSLSHWLDQTSTHWKNFVRGLEAAGGKLEGVYITVGSNDAGSSSITSDAAHLANMQKLVDNVRAAAKDPDLPVIWVGSNRRPPLNAVQADRLRQAESQIGKYHNVLHVQTLGFDIASDNVHLSAGSGGYAACGTVAMTQAGKFVYDGIAPAQLRGPVIVDMTYRGAEVLIDLAHNEGTDFTPAAPGGFAVTSKQANGAYAAVAITSSARVNAGQIRLVCASQLVEPRVVYMTGSAPDQTNAVYSNSTPPLPLLVENEMAVAAAPAVTYVNADLTGSYAINNSVLVRADLQGIYSIGAIVVNVAISRIVKFEGRRRTVRFDATDPGYRNGKWYVPKGASDQLFYAGDVTKQLAEAGTTASRVEAIPVGVQVLVDPVVQGTLMLVKLGGLNLAAGAENYCTLRVYCANGERFDKTIHFERASDAVAVRKDPDDQLYYGADVTKMLADGATSAVAVEPLVVGMELLAQPSVQGTLLPVKLGGLGAGASMTFRVTCQNGERFDKTINFEREDG